MESPSLSQIDLCFRSDDQVSENVIHDAYTFLHFCRACSISIKLDEVVVALSHFLDLVSKFLLAHSSTLVMVPLKRSTSPFTFSRVAVLTSSSTFAFRTSANSYLFRLFAPPYGLWPPDPCREQGK